MTKRISREPGISERFGKLVVTGESFLIGIRRHLPVICDCGKVKQPRLDAILLGKQVSCGCHRDSQNKVANLSHGMGGKGTARHPMYISWDNMVQRIINPNSVNYKWYGGKGISLDSLWLDFAQFKVDMESTWFVGGTIERVDNRLGYSKSNCKWVSKSEQALNRSSTYRLNYMGNSYSVSELADSLGLNPQVLRHKLNRHKGLDAETVVTSMLNKTYLKIVSSKHVNKLYKEQL